MSSVFEFSLRKRRKGKSEEWIGLRMQIGLNQDFDYRRQEAEIA